MRKLRGVVGGLLFLAVASFMPVHAQQYSSVSGVVSDKNGDTITGASVTLDNAGLGVHAVTTTNDEGYYQFLRLTPSDSYQLTFAKDGFKALVVSRLAFGVSTAESRNVTLELGQVTTRIEVTAAGEGTLNTTDASVGNVIDTRAVTELPIQFRLDAANLMQLQAGVNDAGSITGARSDQGNITLDGIDINDQATGQAFTSTIPVSIDALQEVRTITAGETPDFGRSSGGIINLETRGGTNDFHGNIREYNRNTLFAANTWFNNRDGVPRSPLIRNQFGGSLGGPIKKDKLFFFFDYEGVRVTQGSQIERAVPTAQFASGELGYINSNPGCDGTARLNNNPNNCITFLSPAQVAALDPQGVGGNPAILSLLASRYPAPNDPTFGDGINSEGFIFNAPAHESDNVYTSRVDYTLSNKHKFFLRASVAREGVDDFFNTTIEQFPGDPAPASRDEFNGYTFVAGWTWSISGTKTNQFSGALTRAILEFPSITQPTFPNSFSFSANLASPYHGFASQSRDVPVPEVRDNFTLSMGRHTMDFGTDIKFIRQISALENDFSFIGIGLGGQLQALDSTVRPADLNGDPSAVTDYDNFFPTLLGRYSSVFTNFNYNTSGTALPSGSGKNRDFNYNEFEFYAQDSWKMRSDLTVTYGLRYQIHTVPYEINGFESIPNIDFASYYSARVQAAAAGVSGNNAVPLVSYNLGGSANHGAPSYYNPDYKDFGPRVGIAYNPSFRSGLLGSVLGDRKTVLRLGGAILHDRISGGPSFGLDQFTFLFDSSANNPLGIAGDPFDSLLTDPRFTGFNTLPGSNFFPAAPSVARPSTPNVDSNGVPFGTFDGGFPNFFQFNRDTKNPYAILLNFGFQRELPGNFLLEAGYVGRLGRRLLAVEDAATITNFKDLASGQLLRAGFAQLQAELPTLNGQIASGGALGIAPVPWFENQINGALTAKLGPGATCATVFGANCATSVDFFLGQLVGKGDLSDTIQALESFGGLGIIEPNIGLPAQTGANGYIGNYASSNYNALLVTLRKRVSNNLQFDFNYTYSHSIDNVSQIANSYVDYGGSNGSLVCDPDNLRTCRASSDFDARHVVSANYIYDLPFGRGQHFLHDAPRWLDAAVGGWSTSGIVTWRTGYPFTINTGAFPTAYTLDSPAVVTGSVAALDGGIHTDSGGNLQYFKNSTAALAALSFPIGGTIGNRNAATGPGFTNVDMGVTKKFHLPWSEKQSLKLVGNAFNVFNHPSFSPPASATLSDTGQFGIITSTASSPRVLQVALRYEF